MAARKRKATAIGSTLRADLDRLGPPPSLLGVETHEAAARIAQARVRWHAERSRIVDRWMRRRDRLEPADWQELHSPTTQLSVDDPEAVQRVRRNLTRVRRSEAWRHNQLDTRQRQAEVEMNRAWQARTAGTGPASMNYLRVARAADRSSGSPYEAALDEAWRELVRLAPDRKSHVGVVVAIMTTPATLRDVERDFRLPIGEALKLYVRALDLWCELRGWTRRKGLTVADSQPYNP